MQVRYEYEHGTFYPLQVKCTVVSGEYTYIGVGASRYEALHEAMEVFELAKEQDNTH